ncbi:MAG: response regulator [Candidatus Paceibacterota bacterium]|jgi:CheY-like chemotaxis protein|nr:response regulator [Candidatus Paceibacterota bacterium]MDD4830604.1 response regulator [Candidatus Paceibacterota bacterium]MDD4874925.1 response regulator [Candidatus Paceibacterota bacterium]
MAKKILIIEDEEIMMNLLEKKLKGAGYDITTAKNGQEGLDILQTKIFDLILSDIIMPRMGGLELMEKISRDTRLKNIPIIVVSNSGQPVEIDQAKKFGAKDWLVKTEFDPQEVIFKVKRILGE